MPEPFTLLLTIIIGIIAGFFDAVVGAGGLISVPALIALGLPPQVAIATDRLGTLGFAPPAIYKFWKAKKIVWKHTLILSFISLAGALIGAQILLQSNTQLLDVIVGILILVLLPLTLLKKSWGTQRTTTTPMKTFIGFTLFFLIMIFGGFFGQGTGPILFYIFIFFFGFTMLESLATGIIPWLALSLGSLIMFAWNGIINYNTGVFLLIGMAIGSYMGTHTVLKKGDAWVKRVFAAFVIVLAAKLFFF